MRAKQLREEIDGSRLIAKPRGYNEVSIELDPPVPLWAEEAKFFEKAYTAYLHLYEVDKQLDALMDGPLDDTTVFKIDSILDDARQKSIFMGITLGYIFEVVARREVDRYLRKERG